jgi:hypothetical protein
MNSPLQCVSTLLAPRAGPREGSVLASALVRDFSKDQVQPRDVLDGSCIF